MGLGEALSLACALGWAFVLLLFRRAGRSVHPFALNLTKNSVAFALFVPTILVWHGLRIPEISALDYGRLLLSGFLGLAVADTFIFMSLNILGAGLMAILECLYSPFIILFSFVLLHERLLPIQWMGCVLVVGAVLLVSLRENVSLVPRRDLIRGVALGAVATLLIAAGVVIAKPSLDRTPLLWSIEIRYLAGVLGLCVFVPFLKHTGVTKLRLSIPRKDWMMVLGSAVAAYFQMILWLGGMKYAQASIAGVLNQTATIFTILLAAVFLREPLTRHRMAAAAIAMSGVLLITLN